MKHIIFSRSCCCKYSVQYTHECFDNVIKYQPNLLFIFSGRQCGVKDPSWGEIKHFVCFLDTQLRSCEKSIYCDEDIVGDVMSGLKTFVVNFMVRMSKVRTLFI